jgi:hypothetical protein
MLTASRLTAPALLTRTLAQAYLATATTAGARPIPAPDGAATPRSHRSRPSSS